MPTNPFDKFNDKIQAALTGSYQVLRESQQDQLDLEHLLIAMLRQQSSPAVELLQKTGVDPEAVTQELQKRLKESANTRGAGGFMSPRLQQIFVQADAERQRLGNAQTGPEHVLLAVLNNPADPVAIIFKNRGLDKMHLLQAVQGPPPAAAVPAQQPQATPVTAQAQATPPAAAPAIQPVLPEDAPRTVIVTPAPQATAVETAAAPKAQAASGNGAEQLTHFNEAGRAHMVDVSEKAITGRRAVARGEISMQPETLALIKEGRAKKGDVLAVAQVAGIMAAKKTHEIIPMCHLLLLTGVDLRFEYDEKRSAILIEAEVKTNGQTGVEMEALTAVSAAALTIYDMVKAVDRGMNIGNIRLAYKSGGKSGTFEAE